MFQSHFGVSNNAVYEEFGEPPPYDVAGQKIILPFKDVYSIAVCSNAVGRKEVRYDCGDFFCFLIFF